MPNLRELLRIVEEQGAKSYSPAAYAVMEALVEKVEALVEELESQRPPQVDARIAALTADRDSWERLSRNTLRELADAKAEIERLRHQQMIVKERSDRDLQQRKDAECELAEAKAEIERLRQECAETAKAHDLLACYADSLNTDAEIGRLVRGMRSCTRLTRGYVGTYWSDQYTGGDIDAAEGWVGALKVSYTVRGPAEALRAIQKEVGDGKV